GFMSFEERNLIEASNLGLNVPRSFTRCVMSSCGSLYLFPCAVGGRFSDEN
ncbi:hypothetical protein STEG23_002987, partial [Scotinomys teguina]